jgi:hypothetical protein
VDRGVGEVVVVQIVVPVSTALPVALRVRGHRVVGTVTTHPVLMHGADTATLVTGLLAAIDGAGVSHACI